MFKKSLSIAILPLLGLACDQGDDAFPGVKIGELGAPTGKADGAEVSVRASGGYDLLQLRGDAAANLFGIMDDAGGFSRASDAGLEYRYGVYSICVSNGASAACNLYSRDAQVQGVAPYLATIHGARFDSAASEIFGALARVNAVSPSTAAVLSAGRFECGKTSNEVWCGLGEAAPSTTLELNFAGMPALGDGYVYEGWLITADGPVTSGRFALQEGQDAVEMTVDPALAAAATLFVLTVEPTVGDEPGPSDTHIVAGPFVDGQAVLDTLHMGALGSDFLDAKGGFLLQTPSTADIAEDYGQGVWFIDPAQGPGPGLTLPALPAGWTYEGWVVGDDGPISTGRFIDPADVDRDGGGPTAGPDATPPFPGQDFISPARDLTQGYSVVVSVEPEPDDSALPFALKPLAGPVVDAGPGGFQTLGNIAETNRITGLAVLR